MRVQHPEWVTPNCDCPTCDSYELRLAKLLRLTQRSNAARINPKLRVVAAIALIKTPDPAIA